jgi:RNA polymerase sigma-70 factor, ECF subfamily
MQLVEIAVLRFDETDFFFSGDDSLQEMLDRETLEKCRQLDPIAIDQLFRTYEKPVVRLITRMIGTQAEAEDLAQDVFVKIIRAMPAFRGDANLTTWIYRITMNHCLNARRGWFHRRIMVPLEGGLGPDSDRTGTGFEAMVAKKISENGANPMDITIHRELHDALQRGLNQLSPVLRGILILRDVEGLNYDEIAETLGVSIGTVKSRLSRARAALREKIKRFL